MNAKIKKPKFIYLIRTEKEVIATEHCPKDVTIDALGILWKLSSLPSGRIGEVDSRFYYNDNPIGIIGVFRAGNVRHLINMAKCFDWHLRDILGVPRDMMNKIVDYRFVCNHCQKRNDSVSKRFAPGSPTVTHEDIDVPFYSYWCDECYEEAEQKVKKLSAEKKAKPINCEPTNDELIDQIMRRNPLRKSRPIHPGAEKYRRDQ